MISSPFFTAIITKHSKSKPLSYPHLGQYDVIICSLEEVGIVPYPAIKPRTATKLSNIDSILTINNYVKLMVTNFQDKYPDTELSKRLGISRKSLWEKIIFYFSHNLSFD